MYRFERLALFGLVMLLGSLIAYGLGGAEANAQEEDCSARGLQTLPDGSCAPTRGNIETPEGTCESIGQRELESGVCAPYINGVPPANGVAYTPDEPKAVNADVEAGHEIHREDDPQLFDALVASGAYRGVAGDFSDTTASVEGSPEYPGPKTPKTKELPRTGGASVIGSVVAATAGLMMVGLGVTSWWVIRRS